MAAMLKMAAKMLEIRKIWIVNKKNKQCLDEFIVLQAGEWNWTNSLLTGQKSKKMAAKI